MLDLVYTVLYMTLAGSMAFMLFKLIAGISDKWFDSVWHHWLLKAMTVFFLLPIGRWSRLLLPEELFYTPPIVLGETLATANGQGLMPTVVGTPAMAGIAFTIWDLLTWIWLGGVVLTLLWQGACFLKFRLSIKQCLPVTDPELLDLLNAQKVQLGITNEVAIYISPKVSTPMLVGLVKPIIVLPDQPLDKVGAKYVFNHELVHFKQGDLWMKLLVVLITALHWFNPVVYLLQQELNRRSEWACDQTVAEELSAVERKQYAQVILEAMMVQTTQPTVFGTAFVTVSRSTKKHIERRLTIMLATKRMNITKYIMSLVMAMAIMGFATIPVIAAEGNLLLPPTDTVVSEVSDSGDASEITPYKVDYQETRTLGKGKSKTYTFNVSGRPDHNTVSVVINQSAGDKYHYISVDATNNVELANVTVTGNSNRELYNLLPGNEYEVIVINLGSTEDLTYTISLTSNIQ